MKTMKVNDSWRALCTIDMISYIRVNKYLYSMLY
jgi:hypothetical protein